MSYQLGIDLGTVFSVAAVARDGNEQAVDLGSRTTAVPSVVYLDPDGTFRVGDDAVRRLVSEPDRTAREFKRRFGDPTAYILGGTPVAAEALQAELLRHIVGLVTSRMGSQPDRIVVTHPANWGPYKRELVAQMVVLAGVEAVELLSEPEAAALHYARTERVDPGDVVAVYDLGGGTFDAVVLTRTTGGYEITGEAGGLEHLGGADFDQAVLTHVIAALGEDFPDEEDPDRVRLAAILRRECVEAKEALSTDTSVIISVPLTGGIREVRLTREELEGMIRAPLTRTVSELSRVLKRAGVEPGHLKKVLLVGGSSRIPLVARMLTEELGVPVAIDVDPKMAVAKGAAQHAADLAGAPALVPVVDDVPPVPVAPPVAAEAPPSSSAPPAPPPQAPPSPAPQRPTPPSPPAVTPMAAKPAAPAAPRPRVRRGFSPTTPQILAAAGVALVAIVLSIVLLRGGDDGDGPSDTVSPGPVETSSTTGSPMAPATGSGDDGPTATGPLPKDIVTCNLVSTSEMQARMFPGASLVPGVEDPDEDGETKYCHRLLTVGSGTAAREVEVTLFLAKVGSPAVASFRREYRSGSVRGFKAIKDPDSIGVLIDDLFVVGVDLGDLGAADSDGVRRSLDAWADVAVARIRPGSR